MWGEKEGQTRRGNGNLMRKIEPDDRLNNWFSIIGLNISRLRGRMDQKALAVKAGVGRNAIMAIERGKPISLINLIKIAEALGVLPADLFITDVERGEITYKHKMLMDLIDIKKK